MAYENVQIAANGSLYEGWEEVTVTAAWKDAARSFNVRVSEIGGGAFPFVNFPLLPGTAVQIYATGSLIVDGYVDDYKPEADAHQHSVEIAGRSKSLDYVDASIEHKTGRIENKNVLQIAQEFAKPFGIMIGINVDPGAIIPWFQIRQGSTPWAEMMRLLPQRMMTMMGMADGSIMIVKGTIGSHSGGLIQGENIEQMTAILSWRDRFGNYIDINQLSQGTKKDEHIQPSTRFADREVNRYRPKIIVESSEADKKTMEDRVKYEKLRAEGWGTKASIVTPSWRDAGGELWHPGKLVYVYSPFLKIDKMLAIETVEFHQDNDSGTIATLDLVDKAALGDEPGSGGSGSVTPSHRFGNVPAGR